MQQPQQWAACGWDHGIDLTQTLHCINIVEKFTKVLLILKSFQTCMSTSHGFWGVPHTGNTNYSLVSCPSYASKLYIISFSSQNIMTCTRIIACVLALFCIISRLMTIFARSSNHTYRDETKDSTNTAQAKFSQKVSILSIQTWRYYKRTFTFIRTIRYSSRRVEEDYTSQKPQLLHLGQRSNYGPNSGTSLLSET